MGVRTPQPSLSVSLHSGRVVFGGEALFEDLDMTLVGGRWTCLLGPSGVGKSTLLRLVLGLETGVGNDGETGNGGLVTCSDGGEISGRAAYMAQRDLLFPWLSVIENVTLGSRLRGERDGRGHLREQALSLLEGVGIAANAEDRPDTLSGGMRQRAALARTLVEDRPVVLMDEPFSGLDAITRLRLQNLAARLLKGRTVLLVTHDPLEALRLGHRIHVLAGRPARLDIPLEPEGAPPREVDDPALLKLQGVLLKRLAEAAR